MSDKIPVIVIAGPTASGKTVLSISAAKRYGGEIVSADSMQIYRHMNIGTAKPSFDEMEGIPHHMIDIVEPNEDFSAYDYAIRAKKCISKIHNAGKLPIMVGGTGLYIDNVLQNISLADAKTDYVLRGQLSDEAEHKGNAYMHDKLAKIDPQAASNIHPNNIRRVIRALEVYYTTGNTFTHQVQNSKNEPSPYDSIIFMMLWDRDTLYERIDKRVNIMFEQGFLAEFNSLIKMGYAQKLNSMQAIGYKELLYYSRGMCSLDEAIELIKKHSRNYAKRQITWFKRNKDIIMLDTQRSNAEEQFFNIIDRWLESSKGRRI